jgi:CheY-like chemotaxis protein
MPPPHSLRLLLVEDHADTARAISRLLGGQGHDVRTADCVHAALQLAEQQPFDIVISDLGLPDGNGYDLMRLLHSLYGSLKGIAVSGYGMDDDIRRSSQAGFMAHLTKPVDVRHLQATLLRVAVAGTDQDPDRLRRELPC